MSSQRTQQPDTPADIELRTCLSSVARQSFVVIAGAGSGKTTSLVKALAEIAKAHGSELKSRRQRVACITYTEIAAQEIWADVGNDQLVHVSTVHSFLWMLVSTFQADIRRWVVQRIIQKVSDLRTEASNFGPRVQSRTREKNQRDIEEYERQRARIDEVKVFTYGTGSSYLKGILGHDDVIRIATDLLLQRPLFRTLLSQQFPFVFVDESQDTFPAVVAALKAVELQTRGKFCLGFFGDPMQRIFPTGIGEIQAEDSWLTIKKPENFRCPQSVLRVANAIRRDGDGLEQTRGRTINIDGVLKPVEGSAYLVVVPTAGNRDEALVRVREWVARKNKDENWRVNDNASVKLLVIVHRMAAKRLGFGDLYAAMNDQAPDEFKDGFLDATAWPMRDLVNFALPLSDAIESGREFEAISILRRKCSLLDRQTLSGKEVPDALRRLRAASTHLAKLMKPSSGATIRDVLVHLRDARLCDLDPRVLPYLNDRQSSRAPPNLGEDADTVREMNAIDALLLCSASQLWGYQVYLKDQSPFSTQQGIKGAEFPRVLVVLDDEEGTHTQFSYEKYWGIRPPSERDLANFREGKETVVDRTRRLLYVCCTRALTDLIVVLFANEPDLAEQRVRERRIFPPESILRYENLESD